MDTTEHDNAQQANEVQQGPTDESTESATADTGERQQSDGRMRRRVLLIILIILLLLGLAFCSWRDPNAKRGHFGDESPDQVQADLDNMVAADSMAISVAPAFELKAGETTLEARIENEKANHCDQRVRIYPADDANDVLFESGAIAPGECIKEVELAHPFEPGSYELIVEFQGYERMPSLVSDEGRVLGHDRFGAACAAQVTLSVSAN